MDGVLDTIQKNLPPTLSLSLSHWQVGPMEGDFSVNNDLRATELRATSAYSLVEDGDDQLALATAAAAAHIAMEHENRRRSRGGQVRLRALAAGLPQQRERVGEVIHSIRERTPEVIQGIRERTPEVIQGIRERTPEMIEGVRARMPEVLQEIREKTPEVLHGIREFVREHVLPPESTALEYEDSTGRKVSNTAYYNNSLNEDREQPPLSSRCLGTHCNQAWKNLYQVPKPDAAEYYVNFDDGHTQDAVQRVTAPGTANMPNKAIVINAGYANMSDPLDVKRHSPTKRQETQQQHSKVHSAGGAPEDGTGKLPGQPRYEWGSGSKMPEEEKKECDEQANSEMAEPTSPSTSLHSSAKYQWGKTLPSAAEERAVARKKGNSDPSKYGASEYGNASEDVPEIAALENKGMEDATADILDEKLVDVSCSQKNNTEELLPEMPHVPSSKNEESEEATADAPLLDLSSPKSNNSEGPPKEEPPIPSSANKEAEEASTDADVLDEPVLDLSSPEGNDSETMPREELHFFSPANKANEATADVLDEPHLDLFAPQKNKVELPKEESLGNESKSENALLSDTEEQRKDSVGLVPSEAQETTATNAETRINSDATCRPHTVEGAKAELLASTQL